MQSVRYINQYNGFGTRISLQVLFQESSIYDLESNKLYINMKMTRRKMYESPQMEIIPVVIQDILEGSTTTEDFKKDELDWDDALDGSNVEDLDKIQFGW